MSKTSFIGPHTVSDWLGTETRDDGGRLELIWGHYVLSPAPDGQHQFAVGGLSRMLRDAVRAEGRTDLYPVTAVAVRLSTPLRSGVIPDVVLLSCRPVGASAAAEYVQLVVEVWSTDDCQEKRETKFACYSAAGIPFLWTVEQKLGNSYELHAYELVDGEYRERSYPAAPIPVELDLDSLYP